MNNHYTYKADFAGENVLFLQGTQEHLNALLPNGTSAGQAKEGAFYLTTDTHRLYVGRKVSGTDNVYPEEVSSGIVTVAESGDLGAQVISGAAHDGDFYYVKSSNALAVYEATYDASGTQTGGSWIQLNAPTGIAGIVNSTDITGNTALIKSAISSSGSDSTQDAKFVVKAGSNVAISKVAASGANPEGIEISATDTTYAIGADTNSGTARIGLKKDGASALDSAVSVSGSNTVSVTQSGSAITVAGPSFTGITEANRTAAQGYGFKVGFEYTDGAGNTVNTLDNANGSGVGIINPTISYGTQSPIAGVAQTRSSAQFDAGTASLDVYTTQQTSDLIDAKIASELQTADAMTFAGILDGTHSLPAELHNGDTFKVASDTFNLGTGGTAKKGDLVIISGTETDGVVTNPVYNIVPAGDEPLPVATITDTAGANTQTVIAVTDSNNNSADIVTTRINKTGNKITVTSAKNATDDKDVTITVNHDAVTTALDKDGVTLTAITGNNIPQTDTIGENAYTFYVFKDPETDIVTDGYGHITSLKTAEVTLKHNGLQSTSAAYAASTSSNTKIGTTTLTFTDKFNESKTAAFKLSSQSLDIAQAANDNGLAVNLTWGSF